MPRPCHELKAPRALKSSSQMYQSLVRMVNWRQFAVARHHCPICGATRIFIRLDADEVSVRCLSCRASPITLSLVSVLRHVDADIGTKDVYELSSRGPLVNYLRKASKSVTISQFFAEANPGDYVNGVQCQDVERLTYPNESFDVCTSTEVFEHVPDDSQGFSEIRRVLRPNGIVVFTVPLHIDGKTVERARLLPDGSIQHLLPPEYHRDPVRGHASVLAFRNYGSDILEKLISQGFKRAELRRPRTDLAWGYWRPVVVAYRDRAFSDGPLGPDPLLIDFAPK